MASVKDRLSDYLKSKKMSKSEFCRRIGVSSAYVSSMRKSIQPEKVELIQSEFPDLNIAWLLTGEGEMFNSSHIEQHHNQAAAIGGDAITTDARTVEALIKMVETRDRQLEKSQQQIDRLITLLEQQK